jgi:hypothetical protein
VSWTRCAAPSSYTILPGVLLWVAKLTRTSQGLRTVRPGATRASICMLCVSKAQGSFPRGSERAGGGGRGYCFVRRPRTSLGRADLLCVPLHPRAMAPHMRRAGVSTAPTGLDMRSCAPCSPRRTSRPLPRPSVRPRPRPIARLARRRDAPMPQPQPPHGRRSTGRARARYPRRGVRTR